MTTELEKYLNAATRGLWGKRKLEVREELENHVLERAYKHELLGIAREDAIQKSIQELGDARVINHKMTEVYMFSKQLLLGGICACTLVSLGFWQASLPRAFRVQCDNAAQTFQFSGTSTGTFLKRIDTSGLALALQHNNKMQSESIDATVYSDDPSRTYEMTAKNATIDYEQKTFHLETVSLRVPREISQVRCVIQ
jgi:hypothetical protein